MPEQPSVKGFDLNAVLASLITSDGALLWYSDAWTKPGDPVVPKRDVLGLRWLEHMDDEDVIPFLLWIGGPTDGVMSMRYRALLTHKRETIYFKKLPYGDHWLCLAEKVEIGVDAPLSRDKEIADDGEAHGRTAQ